MKIKIGPHEGVLFLFIGLEELFTEMLNTILSELSSNAQSEQKISIIKFISF